MYLEKLNEAEETQNNTTPTMEEDPSVITVTDKNGNTDLMKTEQIENTNHIPITNQLQENHQGSKP